MRTVPPSRCASARQPVGATVVLLVLSALLCAQFKVGLDVIRVVATVVDKRERTVPNLTIDDFIVEEDGQPQPIKHLLPSAELPISIGVILDTSGSMQSKILTAQRALDRFLDKIHPDDEIFLMTFAMVPSIICHFTVDRTKLRNALWTGLNVRGFTALYDSLYGALQHVRGGRHQKKAILLITDGEDNRSMTLEDKAMQYVREADMLVYSIGIRGAPGFDMGNARSNSLNHTTVDMKTLERFGEASGGKAWEMSEATFGNKLDGVLDTLAAELRSQYSIGYYPNHPMDDGKWHSVQVRTKNPEYRVRARNGYMAPTASPATTRGPALSKVERPKYAGRPLGEVLRELQATGLTFVFSTAFVRPTMKVKDEPKAVLPREILDDILRQHKLQVLDLNGTLQVVPARK